MSAGLMAAIVIACVVGALIVLCGCGVAGVLLMRSRRQAQHHSGAAPSVSPARHPVEVAREYEGTIESLDPLFLGQLRRALEDEDQRKRIYTEVDVQKARDKAEFEAARAYYAAAPAQ